MLRWRTTPYIKLIMPTYLALSSVTTRTLPNPRGGNRPFTISTEMSAELSYVQLKVANEARASVSEEFGRQSALFYHVLSGGSEMRAEEAEPFGANSALLA